MPPVPAPPAAPHSLPGAPWLAIDTSSPIARVALVTLDDAADADPGTRLPAATVLAAVERAAARHAAGLLAACDQALRTAGLTVGRLGAIAAGAGPGSFTGLRVGLALAKGLAFAAEKPLVLVSSLHALALDLQDLDRDRAGDRLELLPCLDAGKGEVHLERFVAAAGAAPVPLPGSAARLPALALRDAPPPGGLPPGAAPAMPPARLVLGGSGLDRHRDQLALHDAPGWRTALLAPPGCGPTALSVARLAALRLARVGPTSLDDAVPVYGRPPDITLPRPARG